MSIPKSIKTRPLSAAYKAACAPPQRVFDFTEREQVPKGAGVRDFDDLPAPQGVNEAEAPEGYKARIGVWGCNGCHFDPDACPAPACFNEHRGGRQEVIFVKH